MDKAIRSTPIKTGWTNKEIAERLGISKRQVSKMIKSGKLYKLKGGGK